MTEENKNLAELAKEYDASQIQVLEGLEAVRMRPGMYIGSTSKEGLHHLVWEIVDNSIDEALAGFATHIEVFIEEDDSITVVDDGRGIPVDIQEKTGRPAVETVFTVLHAGGKFGGGGYKVSGGLHGVGSSVVNALSTQLDVSVHRNGKIHYQEYRRGHVVSDLAVIGDTDRHGTTVACVFQLLINVKELSKKNITITKVVFQATLNLSTKIKKLFLKIQSILMVN